MARALAVAVPVDGFGALDPDTVDAVIDRVNYLQVWQVVNVVGAMVIPAVYWYGRFSGWWV